MRVVMETFCYDANRRQRKGVIPGASGLMLLELLKWKVELTNVGYFVFKLDEIDGLVQVCSYPLC